MISPNSYAAQGKPLPAPRDGAMDVPVAARSRVSLHAEPANLSSHATVRTVTDAVRAAEGGHTRDLFALYRDSVLGGSHVQSEFNKRLLAVVSETPSILPVDKKNPADVEAAECVRQAIEDCENFNSGCIHLLSSCLWPVAVVEKVFRPAAELTRSSKVKLLYTLRRLEPVNPTLLCFMEASDVDPNQWERDLRIYPTDERGQIAWNHQSAYWLEPVRHIVHRGHLLAGMKDCFGGPARAVMGWWLLATLARDWFARAIERYGSPFPVAKTNAEDSAAVSFLRSALSLSTKLGGLVVDNETEVELVQAMTGDLAGGYETFLSTCNKEISKLIVGQTTSADAQATGLGSGVAKAQGQVREDISRFDRTTLAATLREQLFKPLLVVNGFKGSPPNIVWGGLDPDEAKALGALLVDLKNASLRPTDEAIPAISERVGIDLERMEAPEPQPGFGGFGGGLPALHALSANAGQTHPSDKVAREKAAALARAFRGELAAVPIILSASASPDEFLANLQRYFATWKPTKVAAVAEEALQLCAAAGAAEVP
jgi:hypothetical protein